MCLKHFQIMTIVINFVGTFKVMDGSISKRKITKNSKNREKLYLMHAFVEMNP